jgi:hypothetical protein
MKPRWRSLELASRLSRAALVAFYSAVALLGSGGLHAIAPGCPSHCSTAPAAPHSHQGCSHHHHGHDHGPARDRQQAPGHCPDGCLICEFAATAAVPVAIVIVPPPQELVETVTARRELQPPCVAARSFWIRGPPAVG